MQALHSYVLLSSLLLWPCVQPEPLRRDTNTSGPSFDDGFEDFLAGLANIGQLALKNIMDRVLPSLSTSPRRVQNPNAAVNMAESYNQVNGRTGPEDPGATLINGLAQLIPNQLTGGRFSTCPKCQEFDQKSLSGTWRLIYASDGFIKVHLDTMIKMSAKFESANSNTGTTGSSFKVLGMDIPQILSPIRLPTCVKWQVGQPSDSTSMASTLSTTYQMQYAFKSGPVQGDLRVGYGLIQTAKSEDTSFTLFLDGGRYPIKFCLLSSNFGGQGSSVGEEGTTAATEPKDTSEPTAPAEEVPEATHAPTPAPEHERVTNENQAIAGSASTEEPAGTVFDRHDRTTEATEEATVSRPTVSHGPGQSPIGTVSGGHVTLETTEEVLVTARTVSHGTVESPTEEGTRSTEASHEDEGARTTRVAITGGSSPEEATPTPQRSLTSSTTPEEASSRDGRTGSTEQPDTPRTTTKPEEDESLNSTSSEDTTVDSADEQHAVSRPSGPASSRTTDQRPTVGPTSHSTSEADQESSASTASSIVFNPLITVANVTLIPALTAASPTPAALEEEAEGPGEPVTASPAFIATPHDTGTGASERSESRLKLLDRQPKPETIVRRVPRSFVQKPDMNHFIISSIRGPNGEVHKIRSAANPDSNDTQSGLPADHRLRSTGRPSVGPPSATPSAGSQQPKTNTRVPMPDFQNFRLASDARAARAQEANLGLQKPPVESTIKPPKLDTQKAKADPPTAASKYMILSEVNGISGCQNFLVLASDEQQYFEQHDTEVMKQLRLLTADTTANPLQYIGCPCGYTPLT